MKLKVTNCQRIKETTEFRLDGLNFLVGPNNAGKGVVKDALSFMSNFFKDTEDIKKLRPYHLLQKKLKLNTDRKKYRDHYSFDQGEWHYLHYEDLHAEEGAWAITVEDDLRAYLCVNWDFNDIDPTSPLSEISMRYVGNYMSQEFLEKFSGAKIQFTYAEIPDLYSKSNDYVSIFRVGCNGNTIFEFTDKDEFYLDLNNLTLINRLDAVLHDLDLEGSYQGKASIERVDENLSIRKITLDESYPYIDTTNQQVFFHSESIHSYLSSGRFFLQGLPSVQDYFSVNNDHKKIIKNIEKIVDYLTIFCHFYLKYFDTSLMVNGDRTFPSNDNLAVDFVPESMRLMGTLGLTSDIERRNPSNIYNFVLIDQVQRLSLIRSAKEKYSTEFSKKFNDSFEMREIGISEVSLVDKITKQLNLLCGVTSVPKFDFELKVIETKISKNIANITNLNLENSILRLEMVIKNVNDETISFSEIGAGIGYVLPVLTLINASTKETLKIIEQPELHLHPKLQGDLGDLIYQNSNEDSKLIIETHSENLILRVLRRIRENYLENLSDASKSAQSLSKALVGKDVRFYYFEPLNDGSTRVHNLNVSPSGTFYEPWPAGFFEEGDDDLDQFI